MSESQMPQRRSNVRPHNAGTSDNVVRLYRRLHNRDGVSISDLSREYKIPRSTMSNMAMTPYKTYKGVKDLSGPCGCCGTDSNYMRLSDGLPMCDVCFDESEQSLVEADNVERLHTPVKSEKPKELDKAEQLGMIAEAAKKLA